ncbi:MAG: sigma-70 family RNA polymerase sigma factor [Pseudomonadota bacterium]
MKNHSNQDITGRPDLLEPDLIQRLQNRQEWAFNTLVNQYQTRLLKIAYSITLDQEESLEVVQDVFVSVYHNIATFRQDSSLFTWLRKITVNHSLNWKRKWKRRFKWKHHSIESENEVDLSEKNSKSPDPEMLIQEKQMETNLMNAVKTLPEKIRLVFVLSTFEGLSYEEIGDMLHIKKGTVSSRLHSARTLLKDTLNTLT